MLVRCLICLFLLAPFSMGCSGNSENRVIDSSQRPRISPEEKARRMGGMDDEAEADESAE